MQGCFKCCFVYHTKAKVKNKPKNSIGIKIRKDANLKGCMNFRSVNVVLSRFLKCI